MSSIFQAYTPQSRALLFYGICVPIRLTVAALAPHIPYRLLLMLACIGIVLNVKRAVNRSSHKWWNSAYHAITAGTVALMSLTNADRTYITVVLVLDVLEGLSDSLRTNAGKAFST